jgi:hypothetical protein
MLGVNGKRLLTEAVKHLVLEFGRRQPPIELVIGVN